MKTQTEILFPKVSDVSDTPLQQVAEWESYDWMQSNYPKYLEAVEEEIIKLHRTPDEVRVLARRIFVQERSAMVLRIYQVACYIYRQMEEA